MYSVFLFPPAPSLLGETLFQATVPGANVSFFACASRMFYHKNAKPVAFLSDLFAFRPDLLAAQAYKRLPRSNYATPAADQRSTDVLNRSGLKAKPPCRGAWAAQPGARASAWTSFWEEASDLCSSSFWEGRGMLKPEQAIAQTQRGYALASRLEARGALIARTTGWKRQSISKAGVMHAHNLTRVVAQLERSKSEAAQQAAVGAAPT